MDRQSDTQNETGSAFEIVVLITQHFNMTATVCFLDPFRAANYLEGRPLFRWSLVSVRGGEVKASNGMTVATDALAQLADAQPGMVIVSSSWTPERFGGPPIRPALRRWARSGVPIGGLDTGAFLLAEAGLLDGRRATVHYEHIDAFSELHPQVEVSEDLYVIDRDRLTLLWRHRFRRFGLQVVRATAGRWQTLRPPS